MTVAEIFNKFLAFYGTRRFTTMSTSTFLEGKDHSKDLGVDGRIKIK
jgi:hypothetical protein